MAAGRCDYFMNALSWHGFLAMRGARPPIADAEHGRALIAKGY